MAYIESVIIESPPYGWRVVVLTEWVTSVAGYFVWEEFETRRLRLLPYGVLNAKDFLYLTIMRGTLAIGDDRWFVAVIRQIDWGQVGLLYPNKARYGAVHVNHAPGRSRYVRYLIYFHPVSVIVISEAADNVGRYRVYRCHSHGWVT